MALADPGRILSMDKLVAAAAHQLRGPQVHVVADPESRGQRRGGGRRGPRPWQGEKGAGLVPESLSAQTLALECSGLQFFPLKTGGKIFKIIVSPFRAAMGIRADGIPGCGVAPGTQKAPELWRRFRYLLIISTTTPPLPGAGNKVDKR